MKAKHNVGVTSAVTNEQPDKVIFATIFSSPVKKVMFNEANDVETRKREASKQKHLNACQEDEKSTNLFEGMERSWVLNS